VTVAFHAGSGLPAMLRFRQGHPNDFGLVPFGEMWVEVWYSGWRSLGNLAIPTQWDILRAGAPYKRMTVQNARFDVDFAPDSFAVAPELRAAFIEARRPMHDRPVDSVSVPAPGLVRIHAFGYPEGALRLDSGWILLQAGHAPLTLARGREALAARGVERVMAALVASARPANGGLAALVDEGLPVYTSAAAEPFLEVILQGAEVSRRNITVVREPLWVGEGGARLRLEPVDLPDVPGSLVAYAPKQAWLYAPDAFTALDVRIVQELAAARGWRVEGIGTGQVLWSEVP
jgi:hypothetical protein